MIKISHERTTFENSLTWDQNDQPHVIVRLADYEYLRYSVTYDDVLREHTVYDKGKTRNVRRHLLSDKDSTVVKSAACSGFNAYVQLVQFHTYVSDQYDSRIVGFNMRCSDNETHLVSYGQINRDNCSSVRYATGFVVSANYTCEQRCDDGNTNISACTYDDSLSDVDCEYAWAFEYHHTSDDRASNRSLVGVVPLLNESDHISYNGSKCHTDEQYCPYEDFEIVRCDQIAYSKLTRLGFEYNITTGFVQRVTHECSLRSDSFIATDGTLRIRLYDKHVNALEGTLVDLDGSTFNFDDRFDLTYTNNPTLAPTTTFAPTRVPTSGECLEQANLCESGNCTGCSVSLDYTDTQDICYYLTYNAYVACADCQKQRETCHEVCITTQGNASACYAPYDVQADNSTECYDNVNIVKAVCDDEPITTSPTRTFVPTTPPTATPTYKAVSLNESARYNEDGSVDVLLNLSELRSLTYTVHSDGVLRESTTYDTKNNRRRLVSTDVPTSTSDPASNVYSINATCTGLNAYATDISFHGHVDENNALHYTAFTLRCSDNETHLVNGSSRTTTSTCDTDRYAKGFLVSEFETCNRTTENVDCELAWSFDYNALSDDNLTLGHIAVVVNDTDSSLHHGDACGVLNETTRQPSATQTLRCDEIAYSRLITLGFEYNIVTGFVYRTKH
ncbi:hypothetical protein CYMTET_9297, partial [Cymbomonas tetramitiformis]